MAIDQDGETERSGGVDGETERSGGVDGEIETVGGDVAVEFPVNRRRFLSVVPPLVIGSLTVGAGCLDRIPGVGLETSFAMTDPKLSVDDRPAISVDGDSVLVRGTIQYGSSRCGTVELAHASFEPSQHRLDVLVTAADDSGWFGGCTDDLVETGYRVEAVLGGDLRRVSATEHHVFGDTYSTTVDVAEHRRDR